jgi:hypothetical protein
MLLVVRIVPIHSPRRPLLCAKPPDRPKARALLVPFSPYPLAFPSPIDHDALMLAAPAIVPPTLPPLAPEARSLLSRFLALGHDAAALALERNQDLFDIILQLADPAAAAWLAHIAALSANRRRELALQTLESICKSSADPIEQRRAAARLLALNRAVDVDGPGSVSTSGRTAKRTPAPSPRSSLQHLPTPSPILIRPNPTRSAEQTLATLIHVITTRSESPTQTRATLDAFFNLDTTINHTLAHEDTDDVLTQFEHDPAFADLAILDRDATAHAHPPTTLTKDAFVQTYTITSADTSSNLTFTLHPTDHGWTITAIHTAPP